MYRQLFHIRENIFACLLKIYYVMDKYVELGYVSRDISPIIRQHK